ncbi:MAG: DUF3822 family protein [Bacteroidales bacterium]
MEIGNKYMNNITGHKLSVFLLKDGFYFAKSNLIAKDKYTVYQSDYVHITSALELDNKEDFYKNAIFKYELQGNKFDSVKINFNVEKYTFVPNTLFDLGDLETYYNFNVGVKELDEDIYYSFSPQANLYTIFAFNKEIVEFFETQYDNAEYVSGISDFIDFALSDCKNFISENNYMIYCKILNNYLDVVVLKDNMLFIANIFILKTNNDLVYYLLKPLSDLKLDGNTIYLNICGDTQNLTSEIKILEKYINNINFIEYF